MMRIWFYAAAALVLCTAAPAKEPKPATPLFASDTPIHVTIQAPMSSLASNRSATARAATMTVDGVNYPITLTPRGITRLRKDTCEFPPLRVAFTQPPPPGSLFEHQKHLKLTVFCKRSPGFQQKILLEYSAYRLYNLMTPESFRARLANVDYLDENGRPYISRVSFFLEDFSDVAKRNGMKQAHMGSLVSLAQIDPEAGARFAIFEDMIANHDWDMRAGPKGTECCHNARLMSAMPGAPLKPVPYDFDYSGLVDAPYAIPPEGLPINDVRERDYRGYCAHQEQARAIAAQLSPIRAKFTGLFATIPGLEPREQAKAAAFIQSFFADLDSGRLFKSCVS